MAIPLSLGSEIILCAQELGFRIRPGGCIQGQHWDFNVDVDDELCDLVPCEVLMLGCLLREAIRSKRSITVVVNDSSVTVAAVSKQHDGSSLSEAAATIRACADYLRT